jgi:hypothetical protein
VITMSYVVGGGVRVFSRWIQSLRRDKSLSASLQQAIATQLLHEQQLRQQYPPIMASRGTGEDKYQRTSSSSNDNNNNSNFFATVQRRRQQYRSTSHVDDDDDGGSGERLPNDTDDSVVDEQNKNTNTTSSFGDGHNINGGMLQP